MTSIDSITTRSTLMAATSEMTASNYWDHLKARMGISRNSHTVQPGLYQLGSPGADSPVFVTANYSLSFDALRTALVGIDAYILVLNTKGVNVWCAAGKKTFGTRELISRINLVNLSEIVKHRRLILPQLGAPGVEAHLIKQQTGFVVEYGPVRAADLPEYLKDHKATAAMRQVNFPIRDRMVLIPVEFMAALLPALAAIAAAFLIGRLPYALAALMVFLGGTTFFPILLPWLPSRDFSTKGAFLGLVAAIPFALSVLFQHSEWSWYRQVGQVVGYFLAMSSSIAFLSLNFTGCSTFTSRTGVRKEIYTYIRPMAISFAIGLVLLLVFVFVN